MWYPRWLQYGVVPPGKQQACPMQKMLLTTGVIQNVTAHQGNRQQWDSDDSGSASLLKVWAQGPDCYILGRRAGGGRGLSLSNC